MLGGTAEFGFDVSHTTAGKDQNGNTAPSATGVSFTFMHTAEKWKNENNMNKFFIQYGHGPGKTFTSGFETCRPLGNVHPARCLRLVSLPHSRQHDLRNRKPFHNEPGRDLSAH